MTKDFVLNYDYIKFQAKIKLIKGEQYIQNFSFVFEIKPELYVYFLLFIL